MARNDTPDPIDTHVGARLRLRRKIIGVSQGRLADLLGVTFQQVQKYEKGVNRISASMLYRASAALEVRVGYFFEGLEQTGLDAAGGDIDLGLVAFIGTDSAPAFAAAYTKLSSAQRAAVRRIVLDLAQLDGAEGDVEARAVASERRRELAGDLRHLDRVGH
jgi:transcriptional regulator with XRE-family HTH domain